MMLRQSAGRYDYFDDFVRRRESPELPEITGTLLGWAWTRPGPNVYP